MREIEARWDNGASIAVGGQGQDSSDPAWWWAGITPGATIGSQDGARVEAGLMLGAMGRGAGRIEPFAMPRAGLGYGPVSIDAGYAPALGRNGEDFRLLQLRLQKEF